MNEDFLEDLEAKIDNFEGHAEQQNTGKSARVADRAAIAAALDELDAEIARFDAMVRNKFVGDQATLAAWEVARHTERDPQKRKNGAKQSAPPTEPPK
jgi:glutathione S-transferase